DDAGVREAVAAYLSECGCSCSTLTSGEELMARLAAGKYPPDFIILDDMLGGAGAGVEIARSLSGAVRTARLLLVTRHVDRDRWRELQASGITVLRKPVSAGALNDWLVSYQPDLARL